jgi:hypothetical protein
MQIDELSDAQLLRVYSAWSEGTYCAGFMDPSEETVKQFIDALPELIADEMARPIESYEREFLDEFRRQRKIARGYDTGTY